MHGEDKAWDSLQVFVQDFRCACVVPVLSAVDFLVFLDIRFSRSFIYTHSHVYWAVGFTAPDKRCDD